jgi:hypothetical protein
MNANNNCVFSRVDSTTNAHVQVRVARHFPRVPITYLLSFSSHERDSAQISTIYQARRFKQAKPSKQGKSSATKLAFTS